MRSHFYLCSADRELDSPMMESYEKTNGMEPRWINIHAAIAHNERVMKEQRASMGLSIQRETLMLRRIAQDAGVASA